MEFELNSIPEGVSRNVKLNIGTLRDGTPLDMRLEVCRGEQDGPVVFLSGCIHGDELNGFEIIRRVVDLVDPDGLSGTLIAAPIVNVFGFLNESRYLPDRRDLNRVFPGRKRGSQASRLAYDFMQSIVSICDFGIDLHTGPIGRFNHPQVRGDFENPRIRELAHAFGAPIAFHSSPGKGTVRRAASDEGIPMLLYEGGEALRFDRESITIGVDGILRVLKEMNMIVTAPDIRGETLEASKTRWLRARSSGVLRLRRVSGDKVSKKERVGSIGDALAENSRRVSSPLEGIVVSHVTRPLVSEGDAILRVAEV